MACRFLPSRLNQEEQQAILTLKFGRREFTLLPFQVCFLRTKFMLVQPQASKVE
jgi:hypothetical protein